MASLPQPHDDRRLWSLEDIMNFFLAKNLVDALAVLSNCESQLLLLSAMAKQSSHPCPRPGDAHFKAIDESLKAVFSYCSFGTVPDKIRATLAYLELNDQYLDSSSVTTELRNVRETVTTELSQHRFIRIVPERKDHVDNTSLLGSGVEVAFPSAVPDIREAGNCLAAECNTAAVFHLMRAVEWGLRALCVDLGFKRVKSKFKKSGKVGYIPIEYAEWERLLDELQNRADEKIKRMKRGHRKQDLQQFYYPALQDIRGIRDAWRNHVVHTRDEYLHEDADAILSHVKRLMGTLAARISEV
jgi:hypothetical protein